MSLQHMYQLTQSLPPTQCPEAIRAHTLLSSTPHTCNNNNTVRILTIGEPSLTVLTTNVKTRLPSSKHKLQHTARLITLQVRTSLTTRGTRAAMRTTTEARRPLTLKPLRGSRP
jgi:hypothetical protein